MKNQNSGWIIKIVLFVIFLWGQIFSQVDLLYTSSLNGALVGCLCPGNPYGGIDRISGTIKMFKKEGKDVIIIDSGDFWGTYPDQKRDSIILYAYEHIPYDIILPGDQEFLYGKDFFLKCFKDFPGTVLKGALDLNSDILADDKVIIKGGIRIAFLGWHTDESFSYIKPKGVKWQQDFNILANKIISLRKKSDIVILVSHAGHDEDVSMIKRGIKPDIIIGGHSQDKFSSFVDSVFIVQAGMDGEALGDLKITKKDGQISFTNRFISMVKSSPVDKVLRNMVKNSQEKY